MVAPPEGTERTHAPRVARLVKVAATLAAAVVLLALALHTPFGRARVLQYAQAEVRSRFSIRLEAARLDYSLATLRIGLADLRLSTISSPAAPDGPEVRPFFETDYLSVALSHQALLGDLSFDSLALTNGRVRILRQGDGTTNLPRTSGAAGGGPQPLRLAQLDVPRVSVEIRDEVSDFSLVMPAMAIRLTPADGRIALGAPAEFRMGNRTVRIGQLEGDAAFDGRALRLADMQVRADGASIGVDGTLVLFARESAVDLRLQGNADVERVALWGMSGGEVPSGTLVLDAQLTGPFGNLQTALQFRSDRLAWRSLAATALSGRARITATAAEMEQLEFGFVGGRVAASAVVPFEPAGRGRMTASWIDVEAADVVRAAAPESVLFPGGTLSGQLDLEGPLSEPDLWSADGAVRVMPRPNERGRLSIAGAARGQLRDGAWQLDGKHILGGVAPVVLAVRGRLTSGSDQPSRSAPRPSAEVPAVAEGLLLRNTIAGGVLLERTDVHAFLEALRATGFTAVPPDAMRAGILEADVQLTGSLAAPEMNGRARLEALSAAQVDADRIEAVFSGRPLARRVKFTINSGPAIVAGQQLLDVRSAGRFADTVLIVDELAARQPSTAGRLELSGRYDLRTGVYAAAVDGSGWVLTPTGDQRLAGQVDLRAESTGTFAEPRGMGQVRLQGTSWQKVALGDIDTDVRLDGQNAVIMARAPDFQTIAEARVQLAVPYAAAVEVRADRIDLARALRDVETPAPVAGAATLVARAEGPLESWRTATATLTVASLDATLGALPICLAEPARLRYAGERLHVERLEASVGDTRLSTSGELPLFAEAVDAPTLLLVATGDIDQVARAAAEAGVTQLAVTGGDGPVALRARVTGSLQAPIISADLEAGPGSITLGDLPAVSGVRLRARVDNGWLELREAAASFQGARVSATGRAPLALLAEAQALGAAPFSGLRETRAGQGTQPSRQGATTGDLELHARATNISGAAIAPFVDVATLEQVAGSVDATLDIASPTLELADLTGEFRLDRLELRIADLPVSQRVPTRIVARDGFARIEAWDWAGQGVTLGVRGQVRLTDRQAAILGSGELDLRMLSPFVRRAGITTSGRLEPRLSITGPLDRPRLDGDLLVANGALRLADPRIVFSDVSARALLTGNSVQLASLTGLVNGGALTGSGVVEADFGGGVAGRLSTDVRGMALEFPQGLRSEVNAALELAVTVAGQRPSGRLSGTVTVARSAYREPMAVVTGLLTTLRTRRLAAGGPSPALAALALDVRLVTDEDAVVDNNYGRFQLSGDLRIIGTAAAPALSGRAELREGGQLFVGRNVYAIASGTIDFANSAIIEPDLNVQATTRAGGEDIEIRISGTPDAPSVSVSSTSDPSLGQAEVVSLLLTGRRLENLNPGDARFVGTQVLGNFSAEVLGFASRAVGLDTVRLGGVEGAIRRDPTAVATEIDPTTRLTFGKSLGANVDVTFSQSLRDGDAQTWIVDYLPARRLALRLVSDDENFRTYAFRHDVTLGGAAPPSIASQGVSRAPEMRVASVTMDGDLLIPGAHDVLRLGVGDRFDFGAWQADRDRLEEFYQQQGYLTGTCHHDQIG